MIARSVRGWALLAVIAVAAAGCGRKGALEPPPKPDAVKSAGADAADKDDKVANPSSASAAPTPAAGGLNALRPKKPPPIKPSKDPFILDWLLN